jgi:glycosyltransferase involved in cell wall biosynthesis
MYLDEVRNMVPQELSGKIIFTGPRSDVESIVNIFDVGILLTNTRLHGEGISNSIIEYMALRKPVIANRGGGTDEVVEDQFNGFLIDSENENQLLEKILFFFNNKKLINEFGRNGRKLIEEKFDIKIMTENYIKLYRKITFH